MGNNEFITCKYTHQHYLGNCFFIIAATLTLARRNGVEARFPQWKHGVDRLFSKPLLHLEDREPRSIYHEPEFHYIPIPYSPGMELNGYFQSEKYFDIQLVQESFQPNKHIQEHLDKLRGSLDIDNAVSIHVRRGDYLNLSDHHPALPVEYYIAAVEQFPGRELAIFSDDPDWCEKVLCQVLAPYCTDACVVRGADETIDLYAMARCKDHIIANSSFSWWSGFLGVNPDRRVIAPKQWFGPAYAHMSTEDLIPERWERL